jgi:hypothetical protein
MGALCAKEKRLAPRKLFKLQGNLPSIYSRTGHEHPNLSAAIANYSVFLEEMGPQSGANPIPITGSPYARPLGWTNG